jgi:plasmid stabilization system protein ParE
MALVITTAQADQQIRDIDTWWRRHRLSAPRLFQEELAEAFSTLATSPRLGSPYRDSNVAGVRRLLLRATRYHLYYVYDGKVVIVLALWSALRGRGPRLRLS